MAQHDAQWPSEDEDFDATTPRATTKSARSVPIRDEQSQSEEPTEGFETKSDQEAANDTAETDSQSVTEENLPEAHESEAHEPDHHSGSTAEPEADMETTPEVAPDPESDADHHVVPAAAAATTEQPAEAVAPVVPAVATTQSPNRSNKSMARTALEIILILGLVGLGLWSWTLYKDNQNLKQQVVKLNSNPQLVIQKQSREIIAHVGQLIDLPSGETPTIASVSDANQAKQQSAFFKNAQDGDKVLMYVKAGEAILYRPSTNKIILVAPLTFNNTTSKTPSTTSTTTPTKTTTGR